MQPINTSQLRIYMNLLGTKLDDFLFQNVFACRTQTVETVPGANASSLQSQIINTLDFIPKLLNFNRIVGKSACKSLRI